MNTKVFFFDIKVNKEKHSIDFAECGPTPPGEIVIRSANCNLMCKGCFAYNYSWHDRARNNKEVIKKTRQELLSEFKQFSKRSDVQERKPFNWFRIIGGEPFLNEQNVREYVALISEFDDEIISLFEGRILIQTNGITLGKLNVDQLESLFTPLKGKDSLKVVVEVSIKGSNEQEYMILTSSIADNYHKSINAVRNLSYISTRIPNVGWTAVAGFGIGITNLASGNISRENYIKTFYNPDNNTPFYHPDNWDKEFQEVYDLQTSKYSRIFANKFPMFGIEDRFRWKSMIHGLKNIGKLNLPQWYDRFQLPPSKINEKLEHNFDKIFESFFYGDPTKYYTGLFKL